MEWDDLAFYCWNDGCHNLGDAPLNFYLIPRLFPNLNLKVSNPKYVLMGIGSILGHMCRFPLHLRGFPWIVFGSGFQYDHLNIPPDSKFFAIRGAKTAQLCNCECARGDPAVLLPFHLPRTIMPSRKEATIWKWDWTGQETDTEFTSRAPDFLAWMQKLWSFERVVTDSLHVAIIADAYGIPWKPLRWEFKWQDHFENLDIYKQPEDFMVSDRGLLAQVQQNLETAKNKLSGYIGV